MTNIRISYHASAWGSDGFLRCLDDLEDLGFRFVEASGDVARHYFDRFYEFKGLLDGRGLKLVAMQGGGELINPQRRDRELAYNKTMCEFLKSSGGDIFTITGTFRPPAGPIDDDFRRLADFCNEIGLYCSHLRLKACIHTAMGSIVQTRAEVDRIMELAEPGLLYLCPDTGHLTRGGADPLRVVNAHMARLGHIYLKDVQMHDTAPAEAGREPSFAELGCGSVDFPAIIDALHNADYGGYMTIELKESPRTPKESAEVSRAYVSETLGIPVDPRPVPVMIDKFPTEKAQEEQPPSEPSPAKEDGIPQPQMAAPSSPQQPAEEPQTPKPAEEKPSQQEPHREGHGAKHVGVTPQPPQPEDNRATGEEGDDEAPPEVPEDLRG